MDGRSDPYSYFPPMGFRTEWPPAISAATIVAWYVDSQKVLNELLPLLQGGDVPDDALEPLDEALEMIVAAAARGDLTLRLSGDAGTYSVVSPDMIRQAAARREVEVPGQGLQLKGLRPLALVGSEILQREVLLEEAGVIFSFRRAEIEQMFEIEAEMARPIEAVFFDDWNGRFPREFLDFPTANAASRTRFETVERLARTVKDSSAQQESPASGKMSVADSIRPYLPEIQRRYRDGAYTTNRPGENHRSPIPRMARDLFALVNRDPNGTLREPSDPEYRSLKSVENQLRLAIRANPELWPGLVRSQ